MNQNPEQLVRDEIDRMLLASGWVVQSKKQINLARSVGVAVREYQTNIGPADYILFVNKKPVGVIEAKLEYRAVKLTIHEEQMEGYSKEKLRLMKDKLLHITYQSISEVTLFTDCRDPKPRSRPVFTLHRPETSINWLGEGKILRARFSYINPLSPVGFSDC